VLDPEMRERWQISIPTARPAGWPTGWKPMNATTGIPDAVLDALRQAGEELEDRLEGIGIPANDTSTQQTAAGQSLGMEAAE
jgi:hypothetical protein